MGKEKIHACSCCEYYTYCPNCRPCTECGAYKDDTRLVEIERDVDDDCDTDDLPF